MNPAVLPMQKVSGTNTAKIEYSCFLTYFEIPVSEGSSEQPNSSKKKMQDFIHKNSETDVVPPAASACIRENFRFLTENIKIDTNLFASMKKFSTLNRKIK